MTTVGIDYSMTSPAVCVHNGNTSWDLGNCEFHFFANPKKVDFKEILFESKVYSPRFHAYEYPDSFKSDMDRFQFLSDWTISTFKEYDNIKVYLEGYSYGSSVGRVFNISENTGILKHKLHSLGIPFETVPPTVVKKYATDKGNANKQLLEDSFISETSLDIRSMLNQTDKQFNPSSDIIDSYYICQYGFDQKLF